ncbi:MAG: hypothetical protein NTU53_04045 [Planctomycetota bacterium]|nr:hypothetical protein [Planctomycetota bacterium]
MPIWEHTQRPMVVGRDRGVVEEAKRIGRVSRVFAAPVFSVRVLMQALRVHPWPKNLLVLAPVFLSHPWGNWTTESSDAFELVLEDPQHLPVEISQGDSLHVQCGGDQSTQGSQLGKQKVGVCPIIRAAR